MSNPRVSIILPTYNGNKTINNAIESILIQNFKDYEFIIVDDCSTDKTALLIDKYTERDNRIIIIRNPINLGLQKSLNKALMISRGEYIGRIDDDDIWIGKNKLQEQVDFLDQHTKHVLVGTYGFLVNASGKIINKNKLPMSDDEIRKRILIACPFLHSTVLFRKSVLNETGKYSVDYNFAEDLDLWLRMGLYGKFYNIPKYLIKTFIPGDNISYNTPSSMRKQQLRETIEIIKTYRRKYPKSKQALLKNRLELAYNYINPPQFITKGIIKLIRLFRTSDET